VSQSSVDTLGVRPELSLEDLPALDSELEAAVEVR
jgi:hypothetical protein